VSISEQIPILEELSTIDVEVGGIEEKLGTQRGMLGGLHDEAKSLEERISADRESVTTMDKTRSELLIELRQMNQQVDRSREKLNRSRNEREANAAQRELEELRKLLRDREDEIEKLVTLADQAKESIDSADAKRSEIGKELEGTEEGTTKSISDFETQKKGLLEQREAVVKKLPPILYRRYQSIRPRRPVAIAAVSDGTCQGCFMTLQPMLYQKMLRLEEFEQCPNCRRIIFYQAAKKKEEPSSSAEQSG